MAVVVEVCGSQLAILATEWLLASVTRLGDVSTATVPSFTAWEACVCAISWGLSTSLLLKSFLLSSPTPSHRPSPKVTHRECLNNGLMFRFRILIFIKSSQTEFLSFTDKKATYPPQHNLGKVPVLDACRCANILIQDVASLWTHSCP